jgi:hypothetical protein
MSGLNSLVGQIKNPRSKVYRRLYIKRRMPGTGLYETSWLELTDDVIKWGTIKKEVDSNKINQFKFSNITITMDNSLGLYNDHTDENSLWFNYADQQRTLVKIESGFLYETKTNGIWSTAEFPSNNVIYNGFISGDIIIKGNNEISIPVVPLTECFRQFYATRLTGWNDSLTASDFITMLRDQQDNDGDYIFRPFFQDTSTGFDIQATSVEYANLNTSTAQDIIEATVWEVIEKLAEAENFVPYVTNAGKFRFVARDLATTTVYHFFGVGGFSSYYGQTIKQITNFGRKFNKYYSRVSVKWVDSDTATSYEVMESDYRVRSDSSPWTLGERTLSIENFWIPTATVAETIAQDLFAEFSAIRREIEFTTSFIPHLDIFDRVLITYDPTPPTENGIWDVYKWADSTGAAAFDDEMIWDSSPGDGLKLNADEFRLISIDVNLDSLECKYIGRE